MKREEDTNSVYDEQNIRDPETAANPPPRYVQSHCQNQTGDRCHAGPHLNKRIDSQKR